MTARPRWLRFHRLERRVTKVYRIGMAVFLTLLVGVSRVHLGVDYPADGIAGWNSKSFENVGRSSNSIIPVDELNDFAPARRGPSRSALLKSDIDVVFTASDQHSCRDPALALLHEVYKFTSKVSRSRPGRAGSPFAHSAREVRARGSLPQMSGS